MKTWLETAVEKGLISSSTSVNSAALNTASRRVELGSDVLDALSEAAWQKLVVDFAVDHGWKAAHCRKSKTGSGKKARWVTTMPTGWFDIVLARPSQWRDKSLYFCELKVRPNVQEPEQKEFEKLFTDCGQTCFLWYPEHWPVIQRILSKPVEE